MNNDHRESISGIGLGFNARPAEPTPTSPEPKRDTTTSEGHSTRYSGHTKTPCYPESRPSLAMSPSFASISKTIGKQLERDERERKTLADEALGIAPKSPEQDLHDRLAKAVSEGSITPDEASRYFALKFPGVDPGAAK